MVLSECYVTMILCKNSVNYYMEGMKYQAGFPIRCSLNLFKIKALCNMVKELRAIINQNKLHISHVLGNNYIMLTSAKTGMWHASCMFTLNQIHLLLSVCHLFNDSETKHEGT